ncbi:ATP-binding protein [Oligoflexus tunisiensis]|uniref:ATP-binding protein n=1 Tax=Oligoflexus tunisiensis TaxID=708132 RepID=UPI00159F3422|nr:ATP-binding protein [Oligoflexus tunisiensis]
MEEYRQCFTQVLKKTMEDSLIALPKEFLRDSARQIDQLNAASAVRQMTDETFNILEQHVDSMIKTVYPKIFTQLHTHLWSFESNTRAIAKQLSKESPRFVVNGDDLRIGDQTRLALTQSLVHLLRNHLDHGIESAEERLPQQKPAYGTITISTKQLPENRFRLTFSDDGRGLAIARLRAKAQEGRLTADKSDTEIAALIWESGMSTAEQVSEISGRGVGMAAIKEFIEGAGGTITIGLSGSEGAAYRPFVLRIELPC